MASSSSPDAAPPLPPLSAGRKLFLVVLLLAFMIGATEAAAAVIYRYVVPSTEQDAIDEMIGEDKSWTNSALRFRSHPYLGYTLSPDYVSPDGTHQHSASGRYRGVDPAPRVPGGPLRILALGGSTTYGQGVEQPDEAWPARLAAKLTSTTGRTVEVLNAGVPNWTSFELLGVATMWLPEIQPDVVILHTGFNDAFTTGYPDEGGADNTAYRHAFVAPSVSGTTRALLRSSYTARVIARHLWSGTGTLVTDINAAMMVPRPSPDVVQDNARTASGRYFRRNLETLVALVQRAGAHVVIVPEPLDPVRSVDARAGAYYLGAFAAAQRNAQIAREVATATGSLFVDVAPALRHEMFLDVVHVEERGEQGKADAITTALLPTRWFALTAPAQAR